MTGQTGKRKEIDHLLSIIHDLIWGFDEFLNFFFMSYILFNQCIFLKINRADHFIKETT
jgi:hypothetical protein